MRLCHWYLFFYCLISQFCFGQGTCLSSASTELEKVFCQIAATPEGRRLPSFTDFRRNNAQVQQLLLKRPAERLGIALPARTQPSKKVATMSPPVKKVEKVPVQPKSAAKPVPTLLNPTPNTVVSKVTTTDISGCQLLNDKISCRGQIYRLANNRQNSQLAPGVLGPTNLLELSSFRGNLSDKALVNNYLADSYQHYIEKMLLIGLGGSTMTYTKFHYTFWELVEKREDFALRVGTMYDFLKKDKASMVVKTRYGNDLPGSIDWCMELSSEVVVCDNGKKNWVYVRQS